jgi:hypothetical protein
MRTRRTRRDCTEFERVTQENELLLGAIEAEFGRLDVLEAADRMRHTDNPALVDSLRRQGRLLAYRREGDDRWWYPGFQFSHNGGISSATARLQGLTAAKPIALIIWLCSPAQTLEHRARPVDLIRSAPDAVIAAAICELTQHQAEP